MSVRLYDEYLELPEIDRLKCDRVRLKYIINHECLGDLERWPYKCELEKVEKRLEELENA